MGKAKLLGVLHALAKQLDFYPHAASSKAAPGLSGYGQQRTIRGMKLIGAVPGKDDMGHNTTFYTYEDPDGELFLTFGKTLEIAKRRLVERMSPMSIVPKLGEPEGYVPSELPLRGRRPDPQTILEEKQAEEWLEKNQLKLPMRELRQRQLGGGRLRTPPLTALGNIKE